MMSTEKPLRKWANLPNELLTDVSERLSSLPDYLRFRSACRSWRSAAAPRRLLLPPWLLLPSPPSAAARRFFSPSDARSLLVDLPEARGTVCRGSSHGWLFLLGTDPDLLLLNPITGARLPLPPLTALPHVLSFLPESPGYEYLLRSPHANDPYHLSAKTVRDLYVTKAVLSSDPAADPHCLAAALLAFRLKIAVCRVGSDSWAEADVSLAFGGTVIGLVSDIAYHRGMLYVLGCRGGVAVCDATAQPLSIIQIQSIKVPVLDRGKLLLQDEAFLVESAGKLLAVVQHREEGFAHVSGRRFSNYTDSLSVYTLKLGKSPRKVRAKSIGDTMLFCSQTASLSASAADFPGWSGDGVYFTDAYVRGNEWSEEKSYGVCFFQLEDKSIARLLSELGWFQQDLPPPIWFNPSLC